MGQTLEGFMCILFGLCTTGYDSPDEIKFHNTPLVNSTWTSKYGTEYIFPQPSAFVPMCESDTISAPSHGFVNGLWTAMPIGANHQFTVKAGVTFPIDEGFIYLGI